VAIVDLHLKESIRSNLYFKSGKKGLCHVLPLEPYGQEKDLQYLTKLQGKARFSPTREHSSWAHGLFINGIYGHNIFDVGRELGSGLFISRVKGSGSKPDWNHRKVLVDGTQGQGALIAAFETRIKSISTGAIIHHLGIPKL